MYSHRDTFRKTLLIQRSLQIQSPSKPYPTRTRFFLSNLFRRNQKKTKKVYLTEEQRIYAKICDPCYVLEADSRSEQNSWNQFWSRLDADYPALEPERTSLLVWYFIVLLVIWLQIFEIPLVIFFGQVVYDSEFSNHGSIIVNYISLLILLADTFMKLNLGYYRRGLLVLKRRKIFRNYMRLSFWIDSISIIVLVVYMFGNEHLLAYLKILFYLKCYDLWKYDNQIQKIIELNIKLLSVYRLFRVVIIFLIYSHWMACGFFAIDYYLYNHNSFYRDNQYTWLNGSAALPGIDMVTFYPWYVWYEYALYWALQTATTVGYGDLTPKNPPEVLYVIVNMIAMCVMFGYFINSVWEIIGTLNQKSDNYKKNFYVLNSFLSHKNVSALLKQKLRAYLDYLWRQDTVEEVEELIIAKLTPSLKNQLVVSIKYPFFLKVRLFALLNFNSENTNFAEIRRRLANTLREERYSQDQYVFHAGNLDTRMFYVLQGRIRIALRDFLYKGFIGTTQNFGQFEFVTEQPRIADAIVVKYSNVYYLDRSEFLEILKQYPENYEVYMRLKKDVVVEGKYDIVNMMCFTCYEQHSFVECPDTHVTRKPQWSRSQFISKSQQERVGEFRRTELRQSKMCLPKLREQVGQFEKVHRFALYEPEKNLQQYYRRIRLDIEDRKEL